MKKYTVQATLMVDEIDMDNEDWVDLEEITKPYEVTAENEKEALDSFHSNIPIATLEDFEITCTKTQ